MSKHAEVVFVFFFLRICAVFLADPRILRYSLCIRYGYIFAERVVWMKKNVVLEKRNEKKSDYPIIMGLDVGFGNTKIISSSNGEITFSSFVCEGSINTRMLSMPTIDLDYLVVHTEEGTYKVGEQASTADEDVKSNRTKERSRAKDPKSRVLFKTAIALGVPHQDGEYHVRLVTGLPNDDFNTEIRDDLIEFLQEPFEIQFDLGRKKVITKKIHVSFCEIIRQPEGTVFQRMIRFNSQFDPDNMIEPNPKFQKYIGIIDIGHGTTDYCIFKNGVIHESEKFSSSTYATVEVYERLRSKIQSKLSKEGYNQIPTDEDLDEVVRTKTMKYAKNLKDFTMEVNESVQEVTQKMVQEILETWSNEINRLHQIVITGGGADLFEKAINQLFRDKKIQFVDKEDAPQMSNVLGFYMYNVNEYLNEEEEADVEVVFKKYIQPIVG